MTEPHPELLRLRAAHRRVRRPDPELRAHVARALAADRRREQAVRWIGSSLVAAVIGVAALLVAHWIAVAVATRDRVAHTPDEAQYQSPREDRPRPTHSRSEGTTTSEPPSTRSPEAPADPTAPQEPMSTVTNTGSATTSRVPSSIETRTTAPGRASTAPDTGAEIRLLRQAEVALSTDPAQALALLRAHVKEFPRTSLPLERSALQILARCATSPDDAAIRARDAFLREHPGSPYAARVRSACR